MASFERQLEQQFIEKLVGLKYAHRADIRDRVTLERNFREKFEALNRVRLTDGEFQRLLDEIVVPDVFSAARTLRGINSFIDTVIGLPANLFYSTGIPVCILVLKRCKKPNDVLFINAAEHFVKGKRQNQLTEEHIAKIVETYQQRREEPRYSRRVEVKEIADEHGYNLNISRYVSVAEDEAEINLAATHTELMEIEKAIRTATAKHNEFLRELGLSPLPGSASTRY